MATRNGIIKKTAVEDFANVRRSGIIAINLDKNDRLKWVKISSGKDPEGKPSASYGASEIILVTAQGQAIRFKESQLRPMSRTAAGVKAMRLKSGDFIAGLDIISSKFKVQSSKLLVVTENGFAKQTPLKDYKTQSRGGSGIKTAKITSKTGLIVAAQVVGEEEELLAISVKGQVIRTKLSDIRSAGRLTSGVRIMKLKEGDKIAGIVCL
jgi:DNA gyrase subunit A